MHEPKRIAIFRMGHLGDTVVALPAFWTVRKRFPNAHIVFFSQEDGKGSLAQQGEVLRRGTVFDDYLGYPSRQGGASTLDIARALVRLRRHRVDAVVYLPSVRSTAQIRRDRLFFRLAGVRRIMGMRGLLETEYWPEGKPLPLVEHVADVLLGHLAKDGVSLDVDPTTIMDMGLSEDERTEAERFLQAKGVDRSRPIVGIGPGSKMPSKLWPIERFVEVAKRLEEEFDPTFVVFGNGAERETCEVVSSALRRGVNAAGELSIRGAAAVFEHCQLYLGNDTGTMHLAASAGVRCVALFSARDWPGRWFPYGKGHVVHRIAVPCEGCRLDVCDRGNLCLTQIGAEEVAESARWSLRAVLAERVA